jgi:hypothetical protein
MAMKKLFVTTAALIAAAGAADAQITVDGTYNFTTGSGTFSDTFDASLVDKLVVVATGEHGFNQTGNGVIGDVFYDGAQLTEFIARETIKPVADDPLTPEDETVLVDDTWQAMFYLDDPGSVHSVGDLSFSGFASRASVTVWGLSGTADGAGNFGISDRDSTSVDLTTSDGSIVIASYGMGGTGNTAFVNNVTLDSPLDTETSSQNNGGGRFWDGHVTGYALDVSAGTSTYSVTDTSAPGGDGRTGAHLIVGEFLAAGGPALPGDTDGDGDVDDADLGVAFSNYTGPLAPNTGGKTAADGDADGDGDVDDADLGAAFAAYTGPLASAAVPEPTSLALLGLGGLLAARRRR